MKWLIAVALLCCIPTAETVAQEVSTAALASASSLNAAFPAPHPRPRPQTINDDDVRGTWEMGLGYTFVRFQSSLFNARMNGLNATVSYYLRDHLALEGNVTAAFSEDARYLFYGGGVKVSKGNPKLQPFAHALVGGATFFREERPATTVSRFEWVVVRRQGCNNNSGYDSRPTMCARNCIRRDKTISKQWPR
jgi:hypothetical protein